MREIYLGKLIASFVPGYVHDDRRVRVYSLIVNLIVGPEVGGWFFPTPQWWVLMLWVVPAVPGAHPVAGAAAVGPGEVDRGGAAGVGPRHAAADHDRLQPVDRRPVRSRQPQGWIIGGVAWALAICRPARGVRSVTRARLLGVADEQATEPVRVELPVSATPRTERGFGDTTLDRASARWSAERSAAGQRRGGRSG